MSTTLIFRLDERDRDAVAALAERDNKTVSTFLRDLVRERLATEQRQARAAEIARQCRAIAAWEMSADEAEATEWADAWADESFAASEREEDR